MNFFINQNSEEPSLKLKLIDDAVYDKDKFNSMLVDATITLDMFDSIGNPVILDSPCSVVNSLTKFNSVTYSNSIIYKFTKNLTKKVGIYEAKITIKFIESVQPLGSDTTIYPNDPIRTLILPLHEKLFINII